MTALLGLATIAAIAAATYLGVIYIPLAVAVISQ